MLTPSPGSFRVRWFLFALAAQAVLLAAEPSAAARDWPSYLGDSARSHYSTLARINRGNVAGLRVAWTFDTGEKGEFQSNNLVVDGVLYAATPGRHVVALDAATEASFKMVSEQLREGATTDGHGCESADLAGAACLGS
jgi:glucose dehydrogenase